MPKSSNNGTRDERLAQALKANLRRRKAQARARSGSEVPAGDGEPEAPEPAEPDTSETR